MRRKLAVGSLSSTTHEDGTHLLSRNVANQLTNLCRLISQKSEGLKYTATEAWNLALEYNVYFISAHQTPIGYKRGKQNLSRNATKNAQLSLKTNEISRPTSKPSFISHVKVYQNDLHTTFQSRPSNAIQFKDQTYILCVCVKNAGSAHQSDKGTLLTERHQPT